MNTDIETYFADGCGRCARFATADRSVRLWAPILVALRRICREAGLEEAVRWSHPCYRHAGRNVAILGAFRGGVRLSFFEAGLLRDPDGVLERQGPNSPHPDTIRVTDLAQLARLERVIRACLTDGLEHAAAGRRAPRSEAALDLPEELVDVLDADPALAEAWRALTPSRRRSYVLALVGVKRAATRVARIVRFRDRILAGKGALDR